MLPASDQGKTSAVTPDILIIGSGFAGIAAGIAALEAGASVLVIEKMPVLGGNSAIDSGELAVAGSPQQKAHGVRDSETLLETDILTTGLMLSNPEHVRILAGKTKETYEWLCALGVKWSEALARAGGHSVPRILFTENASGRDIHDPMLKRYLALGGKIKSSCYVERMLRDGEGGRVTGLMVREGYRFPDEKSGTPAVIRAKKAVILAYGGFAADVRYRMRQDSRLTEDVQTTNQPGATGELWDESERIGCQILESSWIQSTPWNNPREAGQGIGWFFSEYGVEFAGFWINSEGNRFVDESANRKIRSDALFEEKRRGRKIFAIAGEACLPKMSRFRPNFMESVLSQGIVSEYPDLESLAQALSVPAEKLRETVLKFNEAVALRHDPDFGRNLRWTAQAKPEGRWFAAEMSPKVHHCMGGVITDRNAQVLDAKNHQPIPGLFAAGECRGGVFGACRIAACAIADCIATGRTAGTAAAAG